MSTRDRSQLTKLKNIGPTIARHLHEIGIHSKDDLEMMGPAEAFKRIRQHHPERAFSVCYYLYSLQGALMDRHWNEIPEPMKEQLQEMAEA